jgi:hypothetical protein
LHGTRFYIFPFNLGIELDHSIIKSYMRLFLLGVTVLAFTACHRSASPAKSNTTTTTSTTETKTAPAEEAPTVMVNGDGKVVTPTVKTKSGAKVYPVTSARSFTPAQKQNLIYRYKTVPPKVLNVPDKLAKKNARGTYYVLKSKFWYWKQADGFFYLDENYYN